MIILYTRIKSVHPELVEGFEHNKYEWFDRLTMN